MAAFRLTGLLAFVLLLASLYRSEEDCTKSTGIYCGNRQVDIGEECDGGFGCCGCKCKNGYMPTDPRSVNCVSVSSNISCDSRYRFYCLIDGIHDYQYFECALPDFEGFLPCAPGTRCKSPGWHTANPCVPIDYVDTCGNGIVEGEEECETGEGCTEECKCAYGFRPTVPVSPYCEKICTPTVTCQTWEYECGTLWDGCKYVQCACQTGAECHTGNCVRQVTCGDGYADSPEECDGGIGCFQCKCQPGYEPYNPPQLGCRESICTPNSTCAAQGFNCGTIFDGCLLVSCGSCPVGQSCINHVCAAQNLCGNGRIDGPEQCDGGEGCFNCECVSGYEPYVPPQLSCRPVICVPSTSCQDVGYTCGSLFDGCKTVSCGTCAYGFECVNHHCVSISTCGNGLIETGEECDGGAFCDSNCRCIAGCETTCPVTVNCIQIPKCGNGVLDAGEQCEFGEGCINCTCIAGFRPSVPASLTCVKETCVPSKTCLNQGIECGSFFDDCEWINCGACASGSCVNGRCVPSSVCGNHILETGEECDGGFGCGWNCQCMVGYQVTCPHSVDCMLIPHSQTCCV